MGMETPTKLASLQCWAGARDKVSQDDANQHCEEDPKREKLVKDS